MLNERKPNFFCKSCVQSRESTNYGKKETVYCGEQGIRGGFEKKEMDALACVKDKQGSATGLASVISRIPSGKQEVTLQACMVCLLSTNMVSWGVYQKMLMLIESR